jgi:hypothetical protein
MVFVVIALAVAAVAIGLAVLWWSRAATAKRERDAANAAATEARVERDAAQAEAADARAERDASQVDATEARTERDAAQAEAVDARERATAAEALAGEAARQRGLDAELLWALERERTDRTWRHSVAVGPTSSSVFDGVDDALREALQVELDAAREEVGCVVELQADLPAGVSAAASVLALRSAQELLARAVKVAERVTLHVHADGDDLVVAVDAFDADDAPVVIESPLLPPSTDVERTEDGWRVRRATDPPG